jgi:2-oxoisovalerate dehydrogenase E1 component
MRGHEEASGIKYVDPKLLEAWALKDPISNYRKYLLEENVLSAADTEKIEHELRLYIDEEWNLASQYPGIIPETKEELADVYAPVNPERENDQSEVTSETREKRMIDAISEGLDQAMEKYPNLVCMGQDIAGYGGAFKITSGLADKYGQHRVRNTPLCESAILGAALGLSIEGYKSMVEMQFADFVSSGFTQIVNNLAKAHYRWGQNADVVIRMPTGAGVGAGPFHSQSNEAWFIHTPGLKVVYPSTPEDAKGLLLASFSDPNPVMFFEHKALYRSVSGAVPREMYETPIGKARVAQEGDDLTIITYGAGVHWAEEYIKQEHISAYLLDLRTLLPLDYDAIRRAVLATGKVLVLHEDTLIGGIGGEISAWITEHCFEWLDAPVIRCASLDTPVPFNTDLEKNFLAKSRLAESVQRLLSY